MKTKFMPISKEELLKLPTDVVEDVKSTLEIYNECNITFENGKYKVSSAICISSEYAPDHKFIGVVYANDIFTKEEIEANIAELDKMNWDLY